jgi:hypothetical protein|tara:strand:- start:204 stop:527 length:324 start_codon:yes stop_codon:yes gene_type:complete
MLYDLYRKFVNFFKGMDEESVCIADKMVSIVKDVNREAFRSELQKDSGIYCREKYGDYGIDINPDILFRNRRRAIRFVRRYGNRHRKSSTKSKSYIKGGAKRTKKRR